MSQERQDKSEEFERDDMKPEYHFDYTRAKPNRFAQKQADGSLVVVLEPDIAQVFSTPDAVKRVLRALIATMPPTPTQTKGSTE
jgi:hypothetical protein